MDYDVIIIVIIIIGADLAGRGYPPRGG